MRVLIQMRHTPEFSLAARTDSPATAATSSLTVPGFSLDSSYAPVQVPDKQPRHQIGDTEVGRLFTFNASPEVSTYLVRGEVEDERALNQLMEAVERDPNGVGVFSDPQISTFVICPSGAEGTHRDVENLLSVPQLQGKSMDGSNVLVAIVDTGVNLNFLRTQGKNPQFDASRSWIPALGISPGQGSVDHGTMCAFDVCIAAPNCTLLDYALLQSRASGSTAMEGFLSDAVKAYSNLLQMLLNAPSPKPSLVVNNSWGMYEPAWDFPVGHPGNYSDNPNHPFNIIVESLEDAGADILFAAGNCGSECPASRCRGFTNRAIYGANSHPSVLSIAGVTVRKNRVGYSSQGPGRLTEKKPDLCAYTHFVGSGVYSEDNGTSAACPVAAGVVAAIRTVHPPSQVSPAVLRQLLCSTAEDMGALGYDYSHGYGLINVLEVLKALDRLNNGEPELRVGEIVSGRLNQSNDSLTYRLRVGSPVTIELDGPNGVDFDLYIKKGEKPTLNNYDYRGYSSLPDERISLQTSSQGDYYVMVHAYRGGGDFKIKAS